LASFLDFWSKVVLLTPPAIDVWAIGCIFYELLTGKVLFPGKDYVHQMSLIIGYLGTPSDEVLNKIGSEKAKEWIYNMPLKEKVPLLKLLPDADPKGCSFFFFFFFSFFFFLFFLFFLFRSDG